MPIEVASTPNRVAYAGIDVDLDGALAVIVVEDERVIGTLVHDTPTIEIGARSRRDYDQDSIWRICSDTLGPRTMSYFVGGVLLERVGSLPAEIKGKKMGGPFTNFLRGRANAVWQGALIPLGVRRDLVHPATWKKRLGLQGGKENKRASIQKAKALVPLCERHLKLVKHHGRAEAILLAYLAWQTWKGGGHGL